MSPSLSSEETLIGKFDSKSNSSGMEGGWSRASSSSSEYEASFIVSIVARNLLSVEVGDHGTVGLAHCRIISKQTISRPGPRHGGGFIPLCTTCPFQRHGQCCSQIVLVMRLPDDLMIVVESRRDSGVDRAALVYANPCKKKKNWRAQAETHAGTLWQDLLLDLEQHRNNLFYQPRSSS